MNPQSQTTSIRYRNVKLIETSPEYYAYQAQFVENNMEVLIKEERKASSNFLQKESEILLELQDVSGIPEVIDYGYDIRQNYYIVTQFLGPSLRGLEKEFGQFSLKNVLLIGLQLIQLIQSVHQKKIIHHNITLDSIFLGHKINQSKIYLSCFDKAENSLYDIQSLEKSQSINVDDTKQRKDGKFAGYKEDLEDLTYLLIYLAIGSLQQTNKKINNSKSQNEINIIKQHIHDQQLTLQNVQSPFNEWLNYLKNMNTNSILNYTYMKNLLIGEIYNQGFKLFDKIDFGFDTISFHAKSISTNQQQIFSPVLLFSEKGNEKQNDYLSPIKEVDKELENGKSLSGKYQTSLYTFKNDKQLLNSFQSIQQSQSIEIESLCQLEEENECEIWIKLNNLQNQTLKKKSICDLLQLL